MDSSINEVEIADGATMASGPIERQLSQITTLFDNLAEPASRSAARSGTTAFEDRLVESRLGVACSLFTALRCKHAPTAAHSLRVALGCSNWSFALDLPEQARDQLEVAGLLHDVGKIGVPDAILLKPGDLLPDEIESMDKYRLAGLDILRSCCASPSIVEIVRHAPAWYDGSRACFPVSGDQIPLGSRLLAIVDAYDSMTTDHVYRRAFSHERAMNELFTGAGKQFDPELVELFSQRPDNDQTQQLVASRWLQDLSPEQANSLWQLNALASAVSESLPESLFQQKMLDNMYDAVLFVDRNLQIKLWNRGAERLTGITAAGVTYRTWLPSLVGMRDQKNKKMPDVDCPVAYAIRTGVQSLRRLMIAGRSGADTPVDLHTVPVVGLDGVTHGAAVLIHDASGEASLEQRCQNLHERATKDPLTQVANRAEFDRTHQMFVAAHLERRLPCSLIICDIDHFKLINDTYGHQAGDEALKVFAQILKASCRPGDLVARYGGEEFVLLCADCNNAAGAERAEQLRRTVAEMAHPSLGGKRFTVSFGVTEVQAGDTPETMLRRADRALLDAKERGRNMVVQLGTGISEEEEKPKQRWSLFRRSVPSVLLEKWLATAVPLNMTLEKVRGFVADHYAQLISIDADKIVVQIDGERTPLSRRAADRPVPFIIELRFSEDRLPGEKQTAGGTLSRTQIFVAIRLKRDRDRRRGDALERARFMFASIKSYLMANELDAAPTNCRPGNVVLQWQGKRG